MQLFIGNGSRQRVDFYYTLPEVVGHRNQPINPGEQIKISGELSPGAIDAIVSHHQRYGMVRADEVSRVHDHAPICYSIGSPIQPSVLERLINHNDQVATVRGQRLRAEAGMATQQKIDTFVQEFRPPGEGVQNLQMSIVEETRDPNDPSPQFAEGVKLVKDRGDVSRTVQKRAGRRKG